jgi:hypothetical protein
MVKQIEALRKTVKTLGLGPEYSALVAAAEGVAAALDEYPARAMLWAEYRPLLLDLLGAGEAEDHDGAVALLELVRTRVGSGHLVAPWVACR